MICGIMGKLADTAIRSSKLSKGRYVDGDGLMLAVTESAGRLGCCGINWPANAATGGSVPIPMSVFRKHVNLPLLPGGFLREASIRSITRAKHGRPPSRFPPSRI